MSSAELQKAVEPKKKSNFKYTFTCAILASTTFIIIGYDIGVLSGASFYIKEDLKLTDVQLEILMGLSNPCSLVGSFAAARTSDWIGRRNTIVLTAAIFFVAAFVMGFAANYAMLMAGQFAAGVGGAYAMTIVPVYAAEISPASLRGFMTSFPELTINLGILLGYVSNYAFARLPLRLGWRVMLGVSAPPSVLLAFMVLGMPESPRWLVMKGRLADARAVLEKTSDTAEDVAERLADIKVAAGIPKDVDGDVVAVPVNMIKGGEGSQIWKELILSPSPAMRRILLSALGIMFLQQATGIDALVLYTPRVFQRAGMTDANRLLGVTCAVGVAKMLFTLVATLLMDRVGRRPLLLSSIGGMMLSLVGLGVGLTVVDRHPGAKITWALALCIASNVALVSFFSVGLGPISFVYATEILPLRVRALGSALGVASNRVAAGVVTMSFLSLSRAITIGGTFFLYAGITALTWVFVFAYLPETRGRTLEEMGKLFGMTTGAGMDENDDGKQKAVEMPAN
ncbi:hypothetical protein PR202_gb21439 [Eleusine coracana subsp. coracana]|uniref:Major facilitator superfamily (MFS) profile domain-containing protein n=1 Tax=Eleusine coracana subsp. coracana TaxID=191504 RepID=A0AAV5FD47_ELECO|nr:hypothetical protein QOZ80_7BG0606020 [Eleusine coracana subsp. coracana]GJN32897.1 hypothetical protein PR202_gb21439 [Eleusine coracana subsp. coracana]